MSGRGGDPGGEERVLQQRARALAQPAEAPRSAQPSLDVVEFLLAREHYAIESAYVREIWPLQSLTPLPSTPDFVAGIVNIRGRVVSVVDPRRFFDLPARGLTDLDKLVVLRSPMMEFGLLTDAVLGSRRIASDTIQPPLPTLTGIGAAYLRGVTAERLIILDIAALLADPRIVVDEAVQDRAEPAHDPKPPGETA
ncbi:MAG TPA: chemotaxis protein CheW [Rhodanobacteraceae bacterium]|nr:chemotaxis protein CheW [Rhodanobacteraceae bacterium]